MWVNPHFRKPPNLTQKSLLIARKISETLTPEPFLSRGPVGVLKNQTAVSEIYGKKTIINPLVLP